MGDIGKSCPRPMGGHRPDNRHMPVGDPCPCGRAARDHSIGHHPDGDPCRRCALPAESHDPPRKQVNTPKIRAALRARDGWRCMLCDEAFADPPPPFPDPKSVQVDHIVQVWKNGPDALDNLRLAHRRCNMKRQDEEKSPRQLERDENARAHWARVLGKKTANTLEASLYRGTKEGVATAARILLSARAAKKR
jgi:5-methylcytosine-specific restriction endonuclease McrA